MVRRPFVAGNWKMNGTSDALATVDALIEGLTAPTRASVDSALCPPATLLAAVAARAAESTLILGGQDAHAAPSGAHTGDISAEMLVDAGARCVILGHSERRADHNETDADVRAKVEAAWRAGLTAILCVGESEAERDSGRALDVILEQLAQSAPDGADAARLIIAYEPVWAIGSGRTPTLQDIAHAHGAMRGALSERFGAKADGVRLLYGGSVKPGNAAEIFGVADVDGALVGGASLKAADFLSIIDAAAGA